MIGDKFNVEGQHMPFKDGWIWIAQFRYDTDARAFAEELKRTCMYKKVRITTEENI
jgi:hypothetical protein